MNSILIDCGNSFIKGGLFVNGELVDSIQRSTAEKIRECESEYAVVSAVCDLVDEILDELCRDQTEFILGICNEMHGFLLTDEAGNPRTDYISWKCEFGNIDIDGITSLELLEGEEYSIALRNTGMPLRAGLPSVNLLYMCRSEKVGKDGRFVFQTLGDFVLWHLCGRRTKCHPSNAAGTGFYDIEDGKWNEKLIGCCGIPEEYDITFPDVGEEEVVFERKGVKLFSYPAIGDQQAALLGSGFMDKSEISINLGTGAQVSRIITEEDRGGCQKRPYFEGLYLKSIPHIPSGRALNVYIRFIKTILSDFGIERADEEVWRYVRSVEMGDTSLDCDMSFFDNAVTDHNAGSITNIREDNFTLRDMVKAFENRFVFNVLMLMEKVSEGLKEPDKLVFSGGLARNNPQLVEAIVKGCKGNPKYRVSKNDTLYGLFSYTKKEYEKAGRDRRRIK